MVRSALLSAASFLLALPAAAELVAAELDTYRFGATFARFAADDAEACAALCEATARCMAWSQVSAEEASGAACELKAAPGRPEFRPGYLSGLSGIHDASPAPTRAAASAAPQVDMGGYQPVSAGLEVNELLGGADGSGASAIRRPAPAPATSQSYAPRSVVGVTLGQIVTPRESIETAEEAGF